MTVVLITQLAILLTYGVYVWVVRGQVPDWCHINGIIAAFVFTAIFNPLWLRRNRWRYYTSVGVGIAFVTTLLYGALVPSLADALRNYKENGYWYWHG